MARTRLSLAEARRVAIASQGLDRPRLDRTPTARDIRSVIRRLGLIQLDFVNVLIPAHYQPVFSRLGPYPRALFDRTVYGTRQFTEQWPHEACIIPVETWPLLRFRMNDHRCRPRGFEAFLEANPGYVQSVLDLIRERGPMPAAEAPAPNDGGRRLDQAWFGTIPRAVLEYHFAKGALAVVGRQADMARVFDLAERWIPEALREASLDREESHRQLLERAARACGVATAADLADYYRLSPAACYPRLAELVAAGRLRPVAVEGWRDVAYLHADAAVPRTVNACSLLSPFDPLVFYRPRLARLFEFHYRIEIYTPEPLRKYGYYVLPFLLGDRIVARLDLKADRPRRRLVVRAAHIESWADQEEVASSAADELRAWADWLNLEGIDVERKGALAPSLRRAMKSAARRQRAAPLVLA